MIVIAVSFPEKSFHVHDGHGVSLPVPAPTHVISSFLSTGCDDNEEAITALEDLATVAPTIVCGYSPDHLDVQRMPSINAMGRYREGVGTTEKDGIDLSQIVAGFSVSGIKGILSSDNRYIIPGDIYYAYDLGDISKEESVAATLSQISGLVSSIGKTSPAVFAVSTTQDSDPFVAARRVSEARGQKPVGSQFTIYTPWKIPPRGALRDVSLALDMPQDGYVREMMQRYVMHFHGHPKSVKTTYYTKNARNGDLTYITLGFPPQKSWNHKIEGIISHCVGKNPEIFDNDEVLFIPHFIYDHKKSEQYRTPKFDDPIHSVTLVVPSSVDAEDAQADFILSCLEVMGEGVYDNTSMQVEVPSGESKIWESTIPYCGKVSSLATQVAIMSYVKKTTGLEFDQFAVDISPCLYAGYKDAWNVVVRFSDPYSGVVSISRHNHLRPVQ